MAQYRHGLLENAEVTHILRIPRSVKYPRRIVALAAGRMDGEPGLAVLDGPDSHWYREVHLPVGTDKHLLMVHVGRKAAGF